MNIKGNIKIFVSKETFKTHPQYQEPMKKNNMCDVDDNLKPGEIIVEDDRGNRTFVKVQKDTDEVIVKKINSIPNIISWRFDKTCPITMGKVHDRWKKEQDDICETFRVSTYDIESAWVFGIITLCISYDTKLEAEYMIEKKRDES